MDPNDRPPADSPENTGRDPVKLPDKETLKRAALDALADGEEHTTGDIRSRVSADLRIPRSAQIYRYLGKTGARAYHKRMDQALHETKNEGRTVNPRKGVYRLTDDGKQVIGSSRQPNPSSRENQYPPRTDSGPDERIRELPRDRDAYRKWLISELARLEGLS